MQSLGFGESHGSQDNDISLKSFEGFTATGGADVISVPLFCGAIVLSIDSTGILLDIRCQYLQIPSPRRHSEMALSTQCSQHQHFAELCLP